MSSESLGQAVANNTNWINSVISNSKLSSQLAELASIDSLDQKIVVQEGVLDAKYANAKTIRGYKGNWEADTNNPVLSNSSGVVGDIYKVSIGGNINIGSGSIDYVAGDLVYLSEDNWIKISPNQISDITGLQLALDSLADGLIPQGTWNASTNIPDIEVGAETGYFWIVSIAGTTDIGGITDWEINDWAVKTATGWAKIDNTDKVLSVAGRTGVIVLSITDITGLTSALANCVKLTGDQSIAGEKTFTGLIIGQNSGSVQLNLKRGASGTDGNTSISFTQPLGNGYIGVDANGAFSYGIAANLALSKFKVSRIGNATFAGTTTVQGTGDSSFVGNVGIGTDSADARLHVLDTNVGVKSLFATAIIENIDAQLDLTSDSNGTWGSSLNFIEGNGATNTNVWSIARTTSGVGNNLRFNFGTTNHHANDTKMTILSGGNVGIGTDSADSLLNLEGAKNTSIITLGSTNNDGGWSVGDKIGAIDFYSYDGSGAGAGLKGSISYENEQGNTGEYLSLVFRTAGASTGTNNTERMRIASNGNVTIKAPNASGGGVLNLENTTTAVNGTDWGSLNFISNDSSTSASGIRASVVGTSTSFNGDGNLVFNTAPSNGTVTERMRITSAGDVLVGKDSSNLGTNGVELKKGSTSYITNTSSSPLAINRKGNDGQLIGFYNDGAAAGAINCSGTTVSYATSSDYRLKEDLQDFAGLDMVSKIPVYDYKWKSDESRSYGVMAHELQEVLPDAVVGEKDAEEMQGVDYSKIVPLLIKSIQELTAKVERLEAK